ncbi:DMT family transporter [Kaistia algarum]|uniref:DMT family transporter n=1 Tax=Kaistia algarum TaxID=2083279 RepID=UPI0022547911|nr:DMT family transporter [Kaistia algarum]MCX5513707.1 DMT family transporter [Kaistia algarum]
MTITTHPTASTRGGRRLSPRMAGIGLMLLGIFIFSANDALGKWLVDTYSVGAVLLFRSLAAMIALVPFLHRDGGIAALRRAPRPGLQVFRIVLATTEVAMFYASVRYLPLADVMTFYLASPVFVAALSALVLKEKIDRGRWIAILVGFVGVIVVLKPSAASLSWPAVIAMTGSFLYSVLMIVTRQLRGSPDSTLLAFSTGAALIAGLILAPLDWVTPTLTDFGLLSMVGIAAMIAAFCVNRSLKLAPASVVVPYQYTMLLWAVVFGYIFFGDHPELHVLVGAAIVVASGLYILIQERRVGTPEGESVAEEVGSTLNAQP